MSSRATRAKTPMSRKAGVPAALAMCALALPWAHTAGQEVGAEDDLAALLDVMGRVAGLYRDSALEFVADETVTWSVLGNPRGPGRRARHTFDYFYVAADTSDGPGLVEYRTARDATDTERVDLATLDLPGYILRPYSWIFLFLPEHRSLYSFAIEGRDEAEGRPAIVVRFEPRHTRYRRNVDDAFGRIWIDAETYALLRVEAVRSEQVLQMRVDAILRASELDRQAPEYALHRIRVEYGSVTNGLRFPSRADLIIGRRPLPEPGSAGLRRAAVEVLEDGLPGPRMRVLHEYSDYRFFRVSTEEEMRAIVRGDPDGGARDPGRPHPRRP